MSWDAYIEVRGNRYSVPETLVGRRVSLRISLDGVLSVYDTDRLVVQHTLRPASEGWVHVPEHHRALWEALRVERRPLAQLRGGGVMELATLLERMKMEQLLAQLDGVCEQAAKGDLDFKGFLLGGHPNRLDEVAGLDRDERTDYSRSRERARGTNQGGQPWTILRSIWAERNRKFVCGAVPAR